MYVASSNTPVMDGESIQFITDNVQEAKDDRFTEYTISTELSESISHISIYVYGAAESRDDPCFMIRDCTILYR